MNRTDRLNIFFSGIGGSGVSALACFMADRGNNVSGSDRAFDKDKNHPLKKILLSKGITLAPQDGSGLDTSCDVAVFSTAVEEGTPDIVKAKSLGISIKTRPEFLAEISSSFQTIAVSGTSGKSTASGLLAFLMMRLGLDINFIGGGRVKQFTSPSNPGNALAGGSDYLIMEACESDGSIINYRPEYSIILNLALDHHSVDKTFKMFRTLVENTKEKAIINADDKNLQGIESNKCVTFSLLSPAHYRADEIKYELFSSSFSLKGVRFHLSLAGKYNIYNALSCIAMLSELGIPLKDIAAVLPEFQGVARRFDICLNDGERLVIDDYAHNPHKISALMQTVKKLKQGVCYIFQPHGFGPVRLMKNEYIDVFRKHLRDSDRLVILPIFYAGGSASQDISSHDLADGIRTAGKSVDVIADRADILKRVHEWQAYIVFGARDETLADFAKGIADELQKHKSAEARKL